MTHFKMKLCMLTIYLNKVATWLALASMVLLLLLSPGCEAEPVRAPLYDQYRDLGTVEIDAPAGTEVAWCYNREVKARQQDNGRWVLGLEMWCKEFTLDKAEWVLYYRQFPEENTI